MPKISTAGTFRREKIIILAVWLIGLLVVRLLIASLLTLEGTWVATIGAVGIIFAIFYTALKYTPLSKYRQIVNLVLLHWFSKKYILAGVISSMVVLSSLIVFAELGYHYYSDALVTLDQVEQVSDDAYTPDDTDNKFEAFSGILSSSPPDNVLADSRERYGIIGAISILVASVDRSLDGYYVMAISFLFAEEVEVLIFIILVRNSKGRGLFQSSRPKLQEH